jgi:hypothetical protein
MCGDGRLVDMKAYVSGRLGGIEAGATAPTDSLHTIRTYGRTIYELRIAVNYLKKYLRHISTTSYVRTGKCSYVPLQRVLSFESFAQRTRHKKKPVF